MNLTKISRGTLAVCALLLLAGCGNKLTPEQKYQQRFGNDKPRTTATTVPADPNAAPAPTSASPAKTVTTASGDLALSVTPAGSGAVDVSWDIADTVIYTDDARIYLLHGDKPELENDGKTFWWRQHISKTSATWDGIPPGNRYIRACLAPEGDTCTLYSESIMVDVEA